VVKGKVKMEQISVNPSILDITDVDKLTEVGASVDVYPAYYDVILRVSPLVIQKLLMWLLANEYVKLKGTLTVSIRGRSYHYGG
jgi:hypothetical protein